MSKADPIELLFGNMEKLGPGSNEDTLKVLGMLPKRPYPSIVDAGCGSGRQSLVLAKQLQTIVHAVDSHEPFLQYLERKAKDDGLEHLIQTHCMDIADIQVSFREIDLLWSEGAAYNIGFANAVSLWRESVRTNGFLVVSELSWLRNEVPVDVRRFFEAGYPDMRSVDENLSVVRGAGYDVLCTHTLPKETWVDGYYEILEPRAMALLDHPDESVRDFAAETVEEIRIFGRSEDSYGYVFYVLQKV